MPSALAVRDGYGDEERRVFYVGVTRAKDELYLTYPQLMRRKGSMPIIKRVSPFIGEIESSKYQEVVVVYEETPKKGDLQDVQFEDLDSSKSEEDENFLS
jgi:superfamily I DNA/RNA helicase